MNRSTILGPLLFIIYIHNIFDESLDGCVILSYADDTAELCIADSSSEIKES